MFVTHTHTNNMWHYNSCTIIWEVEILLIFSAFIHICSYIGIFVDIKKTHVILRNNDLKLGNGKVPAPRNPVWGVPARAVMHGGGRLKWISSVPLLGDWGAEPMFNKARPHSDMHVGEQTHIRYYIY